jgi:hypothetical protein
MKQLATQYLVNEIKGRYITNETIKPLFERFKNECILLEEGTSVLGNSIYSITIGSGKTKVLMWSQMHGNEATTTKGFFDFLNFLVSKEPLAKAILCKYTIKCIPIVNPDGAAVYTRVNANAVDLNRDAFETSQPESKLLRKLLLEFQPDLAYNLHDQRTIFGTEGFKLPATISFLAPAYNESRDFNETRLKAVKIINAMNLELQKHIPNQVGRFDDSFNINCIGDYTTSIGIPTILFEAGHYPMDYQREEVRKMVFIALLSSFLERNNSEVTNELELYMNIPQNSKCFFDFIYRNVKIISNTEEKIITFAAQFDEKLENNQIVFDAKIVQVEDLDTVKGHFEFDAQQMVFSSESGSFPKINHKANFYLNKLLKFNNGLQFL